MYMNLYDVGTWEIGFQSTYLMLQSNVHGVSFKSSENFNLSTTCTFILVNKTQFEQFGIMVSEIG